MALSYLNNNFKNLYIKTHRPFLATVDFDYATGTKWASCAKRLQIIASVSALYQYHIIFHHSSRSNRGQHYASVIILCVCFNMTIIIHYEIFPNEVHILNFPFNLSFSSSRVVYVWQLGFDRRVSAELLHLIQST